MRQNVFIFHGTGGHPQENWFPWLKAKLEAEGLKVFVPKFPTPEGQSLKAWLKVLESLRGKINQNTIIIAHSLGAIFLLRLLERLEHPIKFAVFVAGIVGVKPITNYDGDFKFSNGFEFDWTKIKQNAKNFFVYHSDNDPYTCIENGKRLAENLGVELTFVPKAGHFNSKAGYTTFEQLFGNIKNMLK